MLIEQCLNQNIMSLREQMIVNDMAIDAATPAVESSKISQSHLKDRKGSFEDLNIPNYAGLGLRDQAAVHFHSDGNVSSKVQKQTLEREESYHAKLVRNHRSTGDVRSVGGVKVFSSNSQIVTRTSTVATDPLFYLDLTFEDSDED